MLRARQKRLGASDARSPPTCPTTLVADRHRLGQVLLNLLGNAIKFTHKGGVTLRVSLAEALAPDAREAVLHFEVQDTGIGIPADAAGAHLRALQAGGRFDDAQVRRHRTGPEHFDAGSSKGWAAGSGSRARRAAARPSTSAIRVGLGVQTTDRERGPSRRRAPSRVASDPAGRGQPRQSARRGRACSSATATS